MPIDLPKDKWAGKIREARLGATPAEGGTRSKSITVGGDSTMPYLQYEAPTAHSPVIAVEIKSRTPEDWSPLLSEAWTEYVPVLGRVQLAISAKKRPVFSHSFVVPSGA